MKIDKQTMSIIRHEVRKRVQQNPREDVFDICQFTFRELVGEPTEEQLNRLVQELGGRMPERNRGEAPVLFSSLGENDRDTNAPHRRSSTCPCITLSTLQKFKLPVPARGSSGSRANTI